jgi:thiol:disulfide interchange protein DsbD
MLINQIRTAILLATVLGASTVHGMAEARASSHHLTVALISGKSSSAGRDFPVAVHFKMEPGWHLYWINPGDSGEPPRVEWELPAGFTAAPITWPTPRRIAASQFVDYGYEDELVLLTRIHAPAGVRDDDRVAANVRWAVCREVCITDRARLTVNLSNVQDKENAGAEDLFKRTRQELPKPMPRSWKVSALSTTSTFELWLRGDSVRIPNFLGLQPVFFPLEKQQIENAASQRVTRKGNVVHVVLKKSEQLVKPVATLKGVVSFGPRQSFLVEAPVMERR